MRHLHLVQDVDHDLRIGTTGRDSATASRHTERRRACAVRPVSQLNLPHDDTTAVVEIAGKHKIGIMGVIAALTDTMTHASRASRNATNMAPTLNHSLLPPWHSSMMACCFAISSGGSSTNPLLSSPAAGTASDSRIAAHPATQPCQCFHPRYPSHDESRARPCASQERALLLARSIHQQASSGRMLTQQRRPRLHLASLSCFHVGFPQNDPFSFMQNGSSLSDEDLLDKKGGGQGKKKTNRWSLVKSVFAALRCDFDQSETD